MPHCSKKNLGFTLTELIVSIGIVFVILSVVVSGQGTYTEAASLAGAADDLSLTISKAQSYGIAVKENFVNGSSDFSSAYGISVSLLSNGSNHSYLYFADRNPNKTYDGVGEDCPVGPTECLEKISLTRGNIIDSICVVTAGGVDDCVTPRRVEVSYLRPNTEAQMTFFNSSGIVYVPASLKAVKITLKSPKGLLRSVIVYLNGQISSI